MNYKNEIYKLNENAYLVKIYNFLKIYYNIDVDDNHMIDTNRTIYKYIEYENIDKYDNNEILYDDKKDKYMIKETNKFPYPLLNIDYTYEIIYKNNSNKWYLLKDTMYDTNYAIRCQQ